MNDLRSLLIGIVGSFIVLGINRIYRAHKIKNIRMDIENLEFEKNRLEVMSKSSVKMNMLSFKAIFALMALIGLANLVPTFFEFLQEPDLTDFSTYASIGI